TDHPNVGLVLDSFHTLARRIELGSIRSIPADKIFIVQLADAPLIEMDLLYWSRHFRNMPGEGDLPVRQFMQAVAATGYDGYLSLEIFNDQFRGGSAKAISVDGRRSLVWLMDQVRREEPALEMAIPPMPDRIGVGGVEFIEFAADRQDAEQLGSLLRMLGFVEAGRHVSKEVTLYRQGEINIVINTERQGFAHSSFVVHGTSAYAMGLKVEDAAATVARAEAL
ncbi:MAG: sugar phosphate isomerase/epimerase and 4-hydroxyphenylpyruvate domain-containing protein, partial [Mesorhizobium sp.]